jgi:GNAT superfamily N-acetyltransferase
MVRMLADDHLGAGREVAVEPLAESYYVAFERVDGDARNLLSVAEDETGRVVGCIQMTFIPGLSNQGAELALVEGVRVDSSLRGGGVGGMMMEFALAEARRRGCGSIELLTHESRVDAQRFYARLGFVASHVGMKRGL